MSGLVFEDILLEAIRSIVLAIIWLGLLRYRHARLLAGEPVALVADGFRAGVSRQPVRPE